MSNADDIETILRSMVNHRDEETKEAERADAIAYLRYDLDMNLTADDLDVGEHEGAARRHTEEELARLLAEEEWFMRVHMNIIQAPHDQEFIWQRDNVSRPAQWLVMSGSGYVVSFAGECLVHTYEVSAPDCGQMTRALYRQILDLIHAARAIEDNEYILRLIVRNDFELENSWYTCQIGMVIAKVYGFYHSREMLEGAYIMTEGLSCRNIFPTVFDEQAILVAETLLEGASTGATRGSNPTPIEPILPRFAFIDWVIYDPLWPDSSRAQGTVTWG